jgi:indole-3-glycerol phosphate synthase
VAELGYELALVGTALMRATDPARLLAELIAAGRSSVGEPA